MSIDRVKKIKSSIVRISLLTNKGDTSTGTGFFINTQGDIVTCWHVIADGIYLDNRNAPIARRVKIKTVFGETDSAELYIYFLLAGFANARLYDYCVLKLLHPLQHSFLKLGNFKDISEGEKLYSCGYPLSSNYEFLTTGILSTKYIDTLNRNIGLIDLTMNKGNSGEPIMKLGKTINDDEVIGIADFIYNPVYAEGYKLLHTEQNFDMVSNGYSQREANSAFAEGLFIMPTGINGCISIDYLNEALKHYH